MPPVVSITLSAYNAEPYLRDSLDCVVNQTLEDVEILCVNDGSRDATLAILKEYAARDSRVAIIDKPVNEGLGAARNDALRLASGRYIGFVDCDDLVDRELFRKAHECAERSQSDLVLWDYVVFWEERELARQLRKPSSLLSVPPTDRVALLRRPAFAWTKLIRTDTARSLGISFPRGLTRQDIPVHWKLLTQVGRIAVLPERLYYYRQHPSATTHRADRSLADLILVYDDVKAFLLESGLYDQYRELFLFHRLRALCGVHDNIAASGKPEVMRMIADRLGDEEWQYILRDNELPRRVCDFYRAARGSLSAKFRRALWTGARAAYRSLRSSFGRFRVRPELRCGSNG